MLVGICWKPQWRNDILTHSPQMRKSSAFGLTGIRPFSESDRSTLSIEFQISIALETLEVGRQSSPGRGGPPMAPPPGRKDAVRAARLAAGAQHVRHGAPSRVSTSSKGIERAARLRAVVAQCNLRAKLAAERTAFAASVTPSVNKLAAKSDAKPAMASKTDAKKPRRRKRAVSRKTDAMNQERKAKRTSSPQAHEVGLPNTLSSPKFPPTGAAYALYAESPMKFGSPVASAQVGSTQTPISPSLFSAPFSAHARAALALCRLSPLVRHVGGAARGARQVAPIQRRSHMGSTSQAYVISPMVTGKSAKLSAQLSLLSPPPTQRLRMDGGTPGGGGGIGISVCNGGVSGGGRSGGEIHSTAGRLRVDSLDAGDGDIMKLGLSLDLVEEVRSVLTSRWSPIQRAKRQASRAPLTLSSPFILLVLTPPRKSLSLSLTTCSERSHRGQRVPLHLRRTVSATRPQRGALSWTRRAGRWIALALVER